MITPNDRKIGRVVGAIYTAVLLWLSFYSFQTGHVGGGVIMLLAAAVTAFGYFLVLGWRGK